MVREEGGVNGKVISSPSSKAQSLPTDKNIPDCDSSIAVWNQILQFAMAKETKFIFHVMHLLIGQQPFINKNIKYLTLAEVIDRLVTKTYMSAIIVDSYALLLITF